MRKVEKTVKNSYIFDEPRSVGVQNAIDRARQQCTVPWSAMRECVVNDDGSWGYLVPARSGREHILPKTYYGVPYSSTRVLDKHVGLDISFSTFVSATENPASIVYTRELSDDTDEAFHPRITNVYFTYGTVCSSLASYAMDLPMHYSTREWAFIPGFAEVASESVDEIALADTMVTFNKELGQTGGHVAVITSIARDGEGRVQRVEITEGWEPTQRYRWDSRAAFEKRMLKNGGSYKIFRNKNIDTVRPPLEIKSAPTDLMLDLGAFSAYAEGAAVQFNIAAEADALVITGADGRRVRIEEKDFSKTEIDGVTYTTYSLCPKAGVYRAQLEKGGAPSDAVEFSVMRAPRPEVTRESGEALPRLAFTPVAKDGTPLTEESACLYHKESGKLLKTAPYALSLNGVLYEAYGAVRERDGKLWMHPSVEMTDENGEKISSFAIGAPISLYIAAAREGEALTVRFAGAEGGEPYSLCPKEEAAVTFGQRLITNAERKEERLSWQAISSPYNRFVGVSIVYKNAHGKITSAPFSMIVLK